ncbi:MAG: manganese efflux pump [Anaerolineales bacterium]|nr:manganese efflux pump [Anaerolineales bacterium]
MTFFEVFLVALSMAMDAFAVCLCAGTQLLTRGRRPAFRLSFHFGLFQAGMPVLGWLLGSTIAPLIRVYSHWAALGLLAFIGIRMIRSGLNGSQVEQESVDPSRGLNLVMLAFATSIDALAVGLTLAFIRIEVWYPAVVIGVVTVALSLLGLQLGNRLGACFGKPIEVAGGLALVFIGMRIVMSSVLP